MRWRKRLWLAVIVACLMGTILEIPDIRLIGRYVWTGRPKNAPADKPGTTGGLTDDVRRTDPEAAAILTWSLAKPEDRNPAQGVAAYLDNEFFLAQLAQKLAEADCVDPRAALTLTDRLIALAPDNAHYHHLRGWVLLKGPWAPGREQEALREFEVGNAAPEFYLPYRRYADRVNRLCDRAGMGFLERSGVRPDEAGAYLDLATFFARVPRTYRSLDEDTFPGLSNAIAGAADRLIERVQTYGDLGTAATLLRSVEQKRLRQLDLAPEQAQQARFEIARAAAIHAILEEWFSAAFSTLSTLSAAVAVALVPLVLLSLLPLVWLFLLAVNRLRGRSPGTRTGIRPYVLFLGGLAGMLALPALGLLLDKWLPGRLAFGLILFFVPLGTWVVLWLLSHLGPADHARFGRARRWAGILCGLLWAAGTTWWVIACFVADRPGSVDWLATVGLWLAWSAFWAVAWVLAAYRQHAFRLIPCARMLRSRTVQLVFVVVLMAGVTILARPVPAAPVVAVFLTVLFAGILGAHHHEGSMILADGLRRLFRRDDEMAVTRTRIVRMLSAVLVVCWVIVLVAVHISAPRWQRFHTMLTNPLSLYQPLPQATRETYERVLATADSAQDREASVLRILSSAAPADMAAAITRCRSTGNPMGDRELLWLLRNSARDTRPVILAALRDPNDLDALLARAEGGDRAVAEPLARSFKENLARRADVNAGPGTATTRMRVHPLYSALRDMQMRSLYGPDGNVPAHSRTPSPGTDTSPPDAANARPAQSAENPSVPDFLLQIADALACVSTPDEADACYRRLFQSLTGASYERASVIFMRWSRLGPREQQTYEPPGVRELLGDLVGSAEARRLVMPQLLGDVNAVNALIARARAGENAVRDELQTTFETRLDELFRALSQRAGVHEQLSSLLDIAGAMAFVSDPQEVEAPLRRLMDPLVAQWRESYASYTSRRAERSPATSWRSPKDEFAEENLSHSFYRALRGVPTPQATALLKTYVRQTDLAGLLVGEDFAPALARLADRELAESVFSSLLKSPRIKESPDIPVGRPFNVFTEKLPTIREDLSHVYLEAIFPHLTPASLPLLSQGISAPNDQVRAFTAWTLTSVGYKWTDEQLTRLAQHAGWQVRVNAAVARHRDDTEPTPTVRAIVQAMPASGAGE